MKDKKIIIFLFAALLLRLAVAPIYHHSDADTIFYWGKYLWETKNFLGFLGKEVPNAMPAVYPPLFYYLIFAWRGFYSLVGGFLWIINTKIGIFPSVLINWFASYETGIVFNKMAAVIADFGCAYFIYKISLLISGNKKLATGSAIFFLFFPASWYLSAYWGQVDSIWSFFVLLSVYALLKEKTFIAVFFAGISILFKQTAVLFFPLILFYGLKKKKIEAITLALAVLFFLTYAVYLPFLPNNTFASAFGLYLKSFRGEIDYLVANAFNFWALFFGFEPKPVNVLFLGFPAFWWGYFIFTMTALLVIGKLFNNLTKMNFLKAVFLFLQSAFLLLPRIHERYFFPAFIFLCILIGIENRWRKYGTILSILFLLNLYNLWFYPEIPILISLLKNRIVIKILIGINFVIYFRLLNNFLRVQSGKIENINK